jgi:hypothetical protein
MKPQKMRAREGLADEGIMSAEIIALARAFSAAGSGGIHLTALLPIFHSGARIKDADRLRHPEHDHLPLVF